MSTFFQYAIIAAFAENAFLNRAIGASNIIDANLTSGKKLVWYSAILVFMTTISSIPVYFIKTALDKVKSPYIFIPIVSVGSMSVIYILTLLAVKKYLPLAAKAVITEMPLATFNCAVMGGIIIAQSNFPSFVKVLGYAFGVGIGYIMAALLLKEGLRRIALADIPKSFRGVPISLIYVGILCLVVYGITGKRFIF